VNRVGTGACALVVVAIVLGCAGSARSQTYDCRDRARMSALASDAVAAADQPDTIGRIQSLSMRCDLEICESPGATEVFREVMDLCVGAPDLEPLYGAGIERLLKTGFFAAVELERKEVPGGAAITFALTGATIVRDIEFTGTWPVLDSVVGKRVLLSRGRPYPNDPESVREQEQAVVELYEQRGLFDTKCRIIRKQVGRHLVDVEVQVTRGKGLQVSRVVIGGHKVLRYGQLRSLLLGPIGWFGSYSDAALREGLAAVVAEYRRRGYYRARIVDKAVIPEPDKGAVEIRIEIDEGPRWDLQFVGNQAFGRNDLQDLTSFRESGYVDEVEIEKSAEAIRTYYEAAGYFFVKVKWRLATGEAQRTLIFEIQEGTRGEVRGIEFKGNGALTDDELAAAMTTRPYALLDSGGFLQRSQIEADLRSISKLYRERGFMRARVPVWQVRAENGGEDLFVTVEIDEGSATVVSDVVLDGNDIVSDMSLRDELRHAKVGQNLSLNGVRADMERVLRRYERGGFPTVRIRPVGSESFEDLAECRAPGDKWRLCATPSFDEACFPSGEADRERYRLCTTSKTGSTRLLRCRTVRPDCSLEGGVQSREVEVRLRVVEGPKVRVGSVLIKGHFRTRPSVIREELPLKEGDLFIVSKMYEGISNLRSLGLFESVSVDTIGLDADAIRKLSESDRVAIVISVEEAKARYTDFRVGGELRGLLQDQTSFILTLEGAFTEANVLGLGNSLQLKALVGVDALELGEVADTATSNLLDGALPPLVDQLYSGEVIWFDPRILWRSQLTVTGFATLDLLGADNIRFDKEEIGLRASLTNKLLDRAPEQRGELPERLTGRLTVEQKRSTTRNRSDDARNAEGTRLFEPRRDITKLSPRLTYDRRNSPLNPTRGYLIDANFDYAVDFIGSPIEFLKFNASFAQFWTYFKTLTLGYGLRFGQIVRLDQTQSIPDDELFFLGGYNSVRGFAENSLGPRSPEFQPRGGELLLNAHTELRFPFVRAFDLYAGYFFDAGVLVDCRQNVSIQNDPPAEPIGCFDDLRAEDFRASAGLGIRWLIGGQIPVAFDYGVVLNRRVGEEFGALHLNLGYTF
jgi:outer membrane protein assembly factor BamA